LLDERREEGEYSFSLSAGLEAARPGGEQTLTLTQVPAAILMADSELRRR
jgi:hypothetical protein